MQPWPFDQQANVACITTRQVIEDGLPILRVVHYADDHSWAFTCGTSNATEDGRVILMAEALAIDASIAEVADLLPGWGAYRDGIDAAWVRILET